MYWCKFSVFCQHWSPRHCREELTRERGAVLGLLKGFVGLSGGSSCVVLAEQQCLIYKATSLFKMLLKYRPEDRAQKKERLLKRAQAEVEGKTPEVKKPTIVKYGS